MNSSASSLLLGNVEGNLSGRYGLGIPALLSGRAASPTTSVRRVARPDGNPRAGRLSPALASSGPDGLWDAEPRARTPAERSAARSQRTSQDIGSRARPFRGPRGFRVGSSRPGRRGSERSRGAHGPRYRPARSRRVAGSRLLPRRADHRFPHHDPAVIPRRADRRLRSPPPRGLHSRAGRLLPSHPPPGPAGPLLHRRDPRCRPRSRRRPHRPRPRANPRPSRSHGAPWGGSSGAPGS
jgi:hypothetical protein